MPQTTRWCFILKFDIRKFCQPQKVKSKAHSTPFSSANFLTLKQISRWTPAFRNSEPRRTGQIQNSQSSLFFRSLTEKEVGRAPAKLKAFCGSFRALRKLLSNPYMYCGFPQLLSFRLLVSNGSRSSVMRKRMRVSL